MAGLGMIDDLEHRLGALEDRVAIEDLINAYGPSVDSGDIAALVGLWSNDGWYSVDGARTEARDLSIIIERESHQRYLAAGCAHVMSAPRIDLRGDSAEARNYSCVLVAAESGWRTDRVSANYWTFSRENGSWRIRTRTNEVISGADTVRRIFGSRAG
jgi:hypothetical protein